MAEHCWLFAIKQRDLQRVSLDRPRLQEVAAAVTPKNGQLLGGKLMAVSLPPCDKLPECPKLEMKVVPEVPKKTGQIPACGLLDGPKVFPTLFAVPLWIWHRT